MGVTGRGRLLENFGVRPDASFWEQMMKMTKESLHWAVVIVVMGVACGSPAEGQADEAGRWFTFHGFGTLSAVRTDDSQHIYRQFHQRGGKAGQWGADGDSQLGLQWDVLAYDPLSATLQVILKQGIEGHYDPYLEWAFLRYAISPNWQVRAGRVLTPAFLESDSRLIGYAQTTVRPSFMVYPHYPLSSHDGADLTWHDRFVSGILTLSGSAGSAEYYVADDINFGKNHYHADLIAGGSVAWDNDTILLRLAHTYVDVHGAGPGYDLPVGSALTFLTNPNDCRDPRICAGYAEKYSRATRSMIFNLTDIGCHLNLDSWNFSGEYYWRMDNGIFPNATGYALVVSRRFGDWTPFLTLGGMNTTTNDHAVPVLGFLSPILAGQNKDMRTRGMGIRWDFYQNMALKTQWDHIYINTGTARPESFTDPSLSYDTVRNRDFNLFTVGLDFVF